MPDITAAAQAATKNTLYKKLMLLFILLLGIGAFYVFDGVQYLSITRFRDWVDQQPILAAVAYFIIYVLVAPLPVATLVTIMGGAVFGFGWGLLLISFASTIGATLSFMISRLLLRDWVQSKFSHYLKAINQGIEREGAFYLFTLRLIPLFPFFAINLVMGLTPMKVWTFYWVSQIGMLAGTAVYVNFGAQLGEIDEISASGILTPNILVALVLLAVFPWVVKKGMTLFRTRMGVKQGENGAAE